MAAVDGDHVLEGDGPALGNGARALQLGHQVSNRGAAPLEISQKENGVTVTPICNLDLGRALHPAPLGRKLLTKTHASNMIFGTILNNNQWGRGTI